jgi:preprotein translocase subunit SecD
MVDGKAAALMSDWRVRLYLAVLLLLGLLPLALGPAVGKPLRFGQDFTGGTLITLQLEKTVDVTTMSTMVEVLQERLNGLGLRDISVRPVGNEFISVSVSTTDQQSLDSIKALISQQGKFEAVIDGNVTLRSEDLVAVIQNPQEGYGYVASVNQWQVPFRLSKEGAERFAVNAKDRCRDEGDCDKVFMFIDRPENAAVIVPTKLYAEESAMRVNPRQESSAVVDIEEFESNSLTKIYVTDEINQKVDNDIIAGNYSTIIVPYDAYTDNELSFFAIETFKIIKKNKTGDYFLWDATGLRSVLFLSPGVTTGEPVRTAVISGGATSFEEAQRDITEMVVVLKSGRLPVSLSIASSNVVSPTLGASFLNDSLLMGLIALVAVGLVMFIRYREPRLTGLIMAATTSEVLIILGIAALIAQEIDIAGVAGIIAIVGTGVDQFIIMVDEVRRGSRSAVEESVVSKIKRAFGIIMGSAATIFAAMVPLLTLGLGLMKGFAITTLIGVFVGIFVVRPAFARVIEKLSGE